MAYVGEQECAEILLEGLQKLEYRGYDSAGVAIWDGQRIELRRCEGKLVNLRRSVAAEPILGSLGIGHTRWATHGRPSEQNAHPHTWGGISLVHNGIIENYVALKQELSARGHDFSSETDTEIAAHLIGASVQSGHDLHTAVRLATKRMEGSYALVVISEDEPDRIVAARQQSPLVVAIGNGETFAASDIPAILAHTRDVIFLEDGETAVLTAQSVQLFDADGLAFERPTKHVLWDPISAEKQGFKHFMLKEIFEQPDKLVDTLRGRISLDRGDIALDGAEPPKAILDALKRVVLVACGTSYHAALVGKTLIEQLARIPVEVDLASEFRYRDPLIGAGDLFVPISQSGETADTLAALKMAHSRGAHVLAVCNVVDSSIPRISDGTLYTHAGPEIGVASTKAFTTQLASMMLLAVYLGRRKGTLDPARARMLLEDLRTIPTQIEKLLEASDAVREIAKHFIHARSFLYLGRGVNYPIALEGALKLKEISYIHAEGYAAGEMKHGPIALIDENMPVVVIAPKSETYEKVFSNLEEVRARGGKVLAVATEGDLKIARFADHVMTIPAAPDYLQPLLTIIPLQLLAYHIADMKGTDIDQPRNLAKSVTVE